MKKHLSLMLVVLLLLSMTAFATPATKVYLSFDYPEPGTNFEVWRTENTLGQNAINNATTVDIPTFRAGTKKIVNGGIYLNTNSNTSFVLNANGNSMLENKSGVTQHDYLFLTKESWDGSVNKDETFVLSYDLSVTSNYVQGANYSLNKVFGKGSDDKYTWESILGTYKGEKFIAQAEGQMGGPEYEYTRGATVRHGIGFKYNETESRLYRRAALDGTVWYGLSKGYRPAISTIEAAVFPIGSKHPSIAKIRMYTINDTIPFAISAAEDGTVSPLAKKLTFKFNRPIVALKENQVSMKVGTEDFTKFKLGEVKMVETETEIYSTVEILFDAILDENALFTLTIDENVTDEIGNKIGSTNNKAEFSTGNYPVFESEISATGMESGDSLTTIENKTTTFNASFKNTDDTAIDAIIFVGVYSEADDKLIGYSFAKTNIASGATQSVGFGTKVKSGTYVKALSFGSLENYAADVDFNSTDVGIN